MSLAVQSSCVDGRASGGIDATHAVSTAACERAKAVVQAYIVSDPRERDRRLADPQRGDALLSDFAKLPPDTLVQVALDWDPKVTWRDRRNLFATISPSCMCNCPEAILRKFDAVFEKAAWKYTMPKDEQIQGENITTAYKNSFQKLAEVLLARMPTVSILSKKTVVLEVVLGTLRRAKETGDETTVRMYTDKLTHDLRDTYKL